MATLGFVEAERTAAHPDAAITRRHIGVYPIPATAWVDAVAASMTPEADRTHQQLAAVQLAATLADELIGAPRAERPPSPEFERLRQGWSCRSLDRPPDRHPDRSPDRPGRLRPRQPVPRPAPASVRSCVLGRVAPPSSSPSCWQ